MDRELTPAQELYLDNLSRSFCEDDYADSEKELADLRYDNARLREELDKNESSGHGWLFWLCLGGLLGS